MKRVCLLLLLVVFFNSEHIAYGSTPKILDGYTSNNNTKPIYKVVILPNDFTVDRGESINFSMHLSGIGYVRKNKITFFTPPKLLNYADRGVSFSNINCRYENNKTIPVLNPSESQDDIRILTLTECSFMWEETVPMEFVAPAAIGEVESLLDFTLNIPEDAHRGDNKVKIILTYTADEVEWYQDEEEITIHVKHWYEKRLGQIGLAMFIGILALLINDIYSGLKKFIWKCIEKFREKREKQD